MSSIILGEIGEYIPLNNNKDYLTTIESIIQEYKISQNDMIVISEKGNIIDIIPLENDLKSENKYFLFSKNYIKESILSTIDSIINKMISTLSFPLIINQNNLPDVHSNYGLLESTSSYLKYIEASEIKITFEKMLEFFENLKIIYSTMKVNYKITEKIKENYQYQYCAINTLIKYINAISDNCDLSIKEIVKEYNKMLEIKETSIKNYNEGIEKLKTTEIHPKLQNNNKKYLIDLYYDLNKITSWKETMIKESNRISDIIKEKTNIFFNENNKIMNEKTTTINLIKSDITSLSNDFDNKINELEKKPILIFNDLTNDFLEFKKALIIIIEFLTLKVVDKGQNKNINSNEEFDNNFDDSCKIIKNLKNKYSTFNSLSTLQSELEPVNDLASKMRKGLENFSLKIHQILTSFLESGKNIININLKITQLKSKISKLNESFIQLQNPSFFPNAYQASIEEIKRRITFNNSLQNDILNLKKEVIKENNNRRIFIKKYGIYLPLNFFPCLKFTDLELQININNDNELSKLPELLDDDDLDKTNNDTGSYVLIYQNNENKNNKNNNKNEDSNDKGKYERIMNFLQNEFVKTLESYEKISENFNETILIKERELKGKIFECENLSKFINCKINNKLDNCPMCNEGVLNSKEYQNWDSFSKDLKKKLNEKESIIKQLEGKYKNLVILTNQMKKTFFTHMNTIISLKNSEIQNKLNENRVNTQSNNFEIEIQKLKDLLDSEKIKNNNLITDNKLLQAKFDNSVEEFKKLESKFELIKGKLAITNEKLLEIIKENQGIKLDKENILLENEKLLKKLLQIENLLKITQSENNDLKLTISSLNNKIEILTNENQNNKKIYDEEILLFKKKITELNNDKKNYIQYKNLSKDNRCIFVPQSEGVYACINLSDDLYPNDIYKKDKFFKCNYLLDMSSFDDDMKNLIVENSLIIIGVIGDSFEYDTKKNNNPLNLPESNFNNNYSIYRMIKLKEVNYIIGFPGEELIFRNYNKLSFDDTI